MKKVEYFGLTLLLVFVAIFIFVKWNEPKDELTQDKRQETAIQAYKKEVKQEIKRLHDVISKKEAVSKTEEQAVKRDTAQQELRIQNEKLLQTLFNYTSLEARSKSLEPFITDELNKKMIVAASDTDSHAGEIVSEYKGSKVYVNMDSERYSTWNTVNVVVNEQKLLIYVQIDYVHQRGQFIVTNLLFKEY